MNVLDLDIYAEIWRRSKLTAHEIGLYKVARVCCLLTLPLLFVPCPFISWLYPLLATYSIAIFSVVCVDFISLDPYVDCPYCIYSTFSFPIDRCFYKIGENKNDKITEVTVHRKDSIFIFGNNNRQKWFDVLIRLLLFSFFFLSKKEKGYIHGVCTSVHFLLDLLLLCEMEMNSRYGATAIQPCFMYVYTMLYSIGVAFLIQAVACERNIL